MPGTTLFANLSPSGEGFGCGLLSPGLGSSPRSTVDRRQRWVAVGARVAFDAAADAVQIEVEDGELDVGLEDLADPPWIEDGRVFARQAGAAFPAQFAPEIAALQRMHVLLQEGEVELQDVVQQTHRLYPGGLGAPEDRLDVLGRVSRLVEHVLRPRGVDASRQSDGGRYPACHQGGRGVERCGHGPCRTDEG
jgi:hypothetical protein